MPTLKVDLFRGIAPKYNRRRLPAGFAQAAQNLRFDSGDLRPLRQPINDQALPAGDIGNLFWYRNDGQSRFIAFGRDYDVQGYRSPVASDIYDRWYWCESGDGLRYISNPFNPLPAGAGSPVGSGTSFKQFAGVRLGIPAPGTAPDVSDVTEVQAVGFGAGTSITSISRTNPVTINTFSAHGFTSGQRVRITIDESLPRPAEPGGGDGEGVPPGNGGSPGNSGGVGQVWALDGLEGQVSGVTPFESGGDTFPSRQFDITGISTLNFAELEPEDIAAVRIERVLNDTDLESRSYVFTYVSQFDEEGPPSPASDPIDVAADGLVRISIEDGAHNFDNDGGSRDYINRIRVYRTVAGGTGAVFLFAGELPFDGLAGSGTGTVWVTPPGVADPSQAWSGILSDGVDTVALGDPIESTGFFPPPNNAKGLAYMANGYFATWDDDTVYFSEADRPHAWTQVDTQAIEDVILGAASYGNTLIVGTHGRPYAIEGSDPSAMVARKLNIVAPLVHPFGLVDAGMGILYVSTDGLVMANSNRTEYLTEGLFDEHEWQALVESRPYITYYEGAALLYGEGVDPLLVELSNGTQIDASYVDLDMAAATQKDGELAIVVPGAGGEYRQVQVFRDDADLMTAEYTSGLLAFRRPVNLACAQVYADGYPLTLRVRHINPASYTDDGQPDLDNFAEIEYTVEGPEPFWLASGFTTREVEFEVVTAHRVQELVLSTSMDELRATR